MRTQKTGERPRSPRQAEVLALLAAGRSKEQIADHLGIRLGIVKHHLVRLYAKLGVWGRHQAVMQGLRQGLIAPEQAR